MRKSHKVNDRKAEREDCRRIAVRLTKN